MKPSDLAHQALARARKDHQEDMKHVDTSINEVLHARDHGVLPHGRELLSLIHRGLVERTSTKDNITLTQLGHMAATHIEGEGA